MSKKNTIIVINNRTYDAKTGELLSGEKTSHISPSKHTTSAKSRPARQPARHAVRHQPKSSKTLMRRAVRKPVSEIMVKPASTDLINKRLRRAKAIPKSQLVTHFSSIVFSNTSEPVSLPPSPTLTPVKPPAPATKAKPTTTAELLEYALQRATSHEQPPVKQKRHSLFRRRKTSIAQ